MPPKISTTGWEGRAKSPVARRRLEAKSVMTPLKPALRKVIGVRLAKISSPTVRE